MHDYKIIEINDDTRIRVVYDESPTCPRIDWDMMTGFVKMKNLGDSRLMDVPAVHDDPTGRMQEAMWQLERGEHRHSGDVAALVERWARIFHDLYVEYDSEHGGFWFVEKDQLVENFYSMADHEYHYDGNTIEKAKLEELIISGEQQVYSDWAEGSVYGVIVEVNREWARVTRRPDGVVDLLNPLTDDDIRGNWEELESVWGYYLDSKRDEDEQFKEFARDMVGDSWSLVDEDGNETPLNPTPIIGE